MRPQLDWSQPMGTPQIWAGPAEGVFNTRSSDTAPQIPDSLPDPVCDTSELSQPEDFALALKVQILAGFYPNIQNMLGELQAALLRVVS